MRYTLDDMRNYAGDLDKIDRSIGGVRLALREAADEIDRLRAGPAWQPIETAPRDGTRILGWDGHEVNTLDWQPPVPCSWAENGTYHGYWYQVCDDRSQQYEPTHWLPIPEPKSYIVKLTRKAGA